MFSNLNNGDINIATQYAARYEYDQYDRVVKINSDYSYSSIENYFSTYTYNGKVVTNTLEYVIDNTKYSMVTETEYYLNSIFCAMHNPPFYVAQLLSRREGYILRLDLNASSGKEFQKCSV